MKKSVLALLLTAGISTAYADIQSVTAISQPTGYGQKVTAVELKYDHAPTQVDASQFAVAGRTITAARVDKGDSQFPNVVHLTLSADDANAGVTMQPAAREPSVERDTTLTVKQLVPLKDEQGNTIPTFEKQSDKTLHLVADDFRQLEFKDASGVVEKAVLTNGNVDEATQNAEVNALLAKGGNVHYMAVRSKTLPDQVKEPNSTHKGQAHIGTWKIAYNIEAIRDWLFAQHK